MLNIWPLGTHSMANPAGPNPGQCAVSFLMGLGRIALSVVSSVGGVSDFCVSSGMALWRTVVSACKCDLLTMLFS